MRTCCYWYVLGFALLSSATAMAADGRITGSQQTIATAAQEGKYTFVLFHREDNSRKREMDKTLRDTLASRQDQAVMCHVRVNDPQEAAVVKRFGVARAPLPLALAVAPNGAITGAFPQKIKPSDVENAFATPTMSECIKAMQDGKLVFLCVSRSTTSSIPKAVQDFETDPQFNKRMSVIALHVGDSAEAKLLEDLEIEPTKVAGTVVAFMAPPGVLVGKYNASATKQQMAAELHAAGKCCNDPHCKHGKQGGK